MRLSQVFWFLSLAVAAIALWATRPLQVFAHDGDPRLTLSAYQLNPGLIVEVVGINLTPSYPISLTLGRDKVEYEMGVVTSDWHGDFVQMLQIPPDAPEGVYIVWANVDGVAVLASEPLSISGPPVMEGGEHEFEQEDGLQVAIPTVTHTPPEQLTAIAQALPPTALPSATPVVVAQVVATTPPRVPPSPPPFPLGWALFILGALIGGGLIIAWRLRRP